MKSLVAVFFLFTVGRLSYGQTTNLPTSTPPQPASVVSNCVQAGQTNLPAQGSQLTAAAAGYRSDTPRWVSNGIAFINLALVCYMAYFTHSSRRKERKEDLARAVGVFWLQDLILKPNIEALHAFFQKYETEMEAPGGATKGKDLKKQAQARILAFKADYHNIRRKVVEPLEMVSEHFSGVGNVFSEIEDFVTGEYEKIPGLVGRKTGSGQRAAADQFRDLRGKFFGALHEGQKRLVTPGT